MQGVRGLVRPNVRVSEEGPLFGASCVTRVAEYAHRAECGCGVAQRESQAAELYRPQPLLPPRSRRPSACVCTLKMTEIPHVSVSELHPTVQADVRYNDSLVEGLELPCWLIQALAHEAMEHNILAAQGRRLIIESWVRLPDGAVYTQWLRDLLLAWLSKQLGRDVRLEEIRWFFALNTAGANPEKELLDWVSSVPITAHRSRPAGSTRSERRFVSCSPACAAS